MNDIAANRNPYALRAFLFFAATAFFFSCKKDDHDSRVAHMVGPIQTILMAHVWLRDSIIYPGNPTIVYKYPKYTRTFAEQRYFFGVETSGTPTDTLRYNMKEPNTIYYWREGEPRDSSDYFTIDNVTDSSLTLLFPGTYMFYEWLHAK